ncbi:MAG: DUF484 family protein [Alphaproteobacteria bacterium]|nr:DUF484 family protein [Alphaproteobacteria bacterium]
MTQTRKNNPETGLTEEDVTRWLGENPDFLPAHPELLDNLAAPSRKLGRGVADLQQALIEKLRGDLILARERQRELVDTSRANLNSQTRIHECIVTMMSATSFEQLIQTITTDFAVLLDLDVVTLCIEADGADLGTPHSRGLHIVPTGTVDHVMGSGRHVLLRSFIEGEPEIYGGGAPLVASDALARISIAPKTPPGLIAFGSRTAGKFEAGQAVELLAFLARVTERAIRLWLKQN